MRLLVVAVLILWGCRESEFKGALTGDAVAKTQSEAPSESACDEEWTAEPPTRGEPKVSGPPYHHLNEDSKCGLHDKLRKFRWDVWQYEQAIEVEKQYLDHWLSWDVRNAWTPNPFPREHANNVSNDGKICGDWGGDSNEVHQQAGSVSWAMNHYWVMRLQKLISKYETLHPTPGVPARLSFGNEELVRSQGGEAVTNYLAKLETIVAEIAKLEHSNNEGMRQVEKQFLEAIDGCSPDMTISMCPHPAISWNISDGSCGRLSGGLL